MNKYIIRQCPKTHLRNFNHEQPVNSFFLPGDHVGKNIIVNIYFLRSNEINLSFFISVTIYLTCMAEMKIII